MRRKDREVTTVDGIKEILDSCKTASIAMIDGSAPYVVPLNYGYEMVDGKLTMYFHSAKEGRKIDILKNNNKVCFTTFSEGEPIFTETPCNSGYYYSSVIGEGTAEFIENPSEKKHALQKIVEHQMGKRFEFTDEQADSVCVFKIISKTYSGKRKPSANSYRSAL